MITTQHYLHSFLAHCGRSEDHGFSVRPSEQILLLLIHLVLRFVGFAWTDELCYNVFDDF